MEYPSLDKPTAGATRFNTDSSQLEIYDGNQWTGVLGTSSEQQTGGARLVFGGGYSNSPHGDMDTMDYVNVATTGNATDFGNFTQGRSAKGGGSSRTRGIFQGGRFSPSSDGYNIIDYITFSSTGNAINFGDLTGETRNPAKQGFSDQTRAIFAGGYGMPGQSHTNGMEYISISSTGNSVDFGDQESYGWAWNHAGSSPTRGILASGRSPSTWYNNIQYVTISTTGNSADFGDITTAGRANHSSSMTNAIRMVMPGGLMAPAASPTWTNTIDYVAIATLGNAIDFGDISSTGEQGAAAGSSPTRGVVAIGHETAGNVIHHIQIMSAGDSLDFGDLSSARRVYGSCSSGHGGL